MVVVITWRAQRIQEQDKRSHLWFVGSTVNSDLALSFIRRDFFEQNSLQADLESNVAS